MRTGLLLTDVMAFYYSRAELNSIIRLATSRVLPLVEQAAP